MITRNLGVLAAGIVAATLAVSQGADSAGQPRLAFRTIPIEGVPSSEHKVTPYRLYDKLVVTVWDPVACGQKPHDAAVSIRGGIVFLSYSLTAATGGAKACTLVSEFEVADVPNRDLEVQFAGGAEPYVVARMRKCPNYTPAGGDIWECLVPAKS